MPDKIHELLNYWFGNLGSADLPSSDRTNMWFGDDDTVKQQLLNTFMQEYKDAAEGKLIDWSKSPRGRLALIILLDQFSRCYHRHSSQAFAFDEQAQQLCAEGLREKMDQSLTLIDRIFFLSQVARITYSLLLIY